MVVPSVMVLPLLIVVAAGLYYIYNEIVLFWSPCSVRNKVVVITDTVSRVGSECAHLLHKGGARLILCGPTWDQLESLCDSMTSNADLKEITASSPGLTQWQDILSDSTLSTGGDSKLPSETFPPKLVLLDFSDMESMPEVVSDVLEAYGYVDVLVCNSSMKVRAPVQDVSLELDRNIMDINYFGPSTLAKGVLPTMTSRRSGHIILVNSIQGRLAIPFRSSYAASKHAAQAFFECLRAEVEEYGIRVSTISHTFINSSAPPPPPPNTTDPKPNALAAFIASHLTHGVRPSVLATEIVRTVNTKRKEVLLAHPIPWATLYLRCLLPSFLFAVVASGVKDSDLAEEKQ